MIRSRQDLARLASGEGLSGGERSAIIARTPAVVWLGYSVHGDEISTTDAALTLAYHLLAAENDTVVDTILENTIVLIDPVQNPDGRARFIQSFEDSRGLVPQGDRYAAEHDQPWPRGRFNHYLFDMNRDWFTLSQPETMGRVETFLEWFPVVAVDAHEMGGDETYFFPPASEPFNPYVREAQRQKQDLIGRNHARWFDASGIEYFTREIFDAFYPGYGDMWPTLNGAIAMTYEQGSARGLVFDRKDGRQLTFRDGVEAHFLATLSTAEVVAENKSLFLTDYARYRAAAVEAGRRADNRYIAFDLSENRWQAERLGRQLAAQGIDVQRLDGPRTVCGAEMARGALVIDTAQPQRQLIETLLRPDTPLDEAFVADQEARRGRGLDWQLYDVTAWSLPRNRCRNRHIRPERRAIGKVDTPAGLHRDA
ncbi:MAG: M14 family metallopeptidase [Pseudomonadota bacterium]